MRLWRNCENTREGKYLVKRRDGSVPEWPWFVLGAADPAAPAALRAYADAAERLQFDPQYVVDIRTLAEEFFDYHSEAEVEGDPDAAPHRTDDPKIIQEMRSSR